MDTDLYIVTNGDGYVYHDEDGQHLKTGEELPAFIEWLKAEGSLDDEAPHLILTYRLVEVD